VYREMNGRLTLLGKHYEAFGSAVQALNHKIQGILSDQRPLTRDFMMFHEIPPCLEPIDSSVQGC
jgi:hypothetical protein